jgi:Ca2+/Na+ antiporter
MTLGLVLLAAGAQDHPKTAFAPVDLAVLGALLLVIFVVYVFVLLTRYAEEEQDVRDALALSSGAVERRRGLVYEHVVRSPWYGIIAIALAGIAGAFVGGERVAYFAATAIDDLGFNHILTSLLLAGFAGMSEYVILWRSHRKGEYGIALANAFGGITQVMYLVFPFTLLSIAGYAAFVNPAHPELPLGFSMSNVLLLVFLAPTFFVLGELIEDDHTLGALDASIMTMIFLLLILLLVTYGAEPLTG